MGVSGNLMEWYDFAIYGYMVPVISALFFPSDDPVATIIATFSAFAAGYFARPVGGIIFGHIGDRYGRKVMLLWSLSLMGASTCAIGLLPTTSQLGVTAAAVLVFLRILQGMTVGGEYTGSITFILEHTKPRRRGLATSWIAVGAHHGTAQTRGCGYGRGTLCQGPAGALACYAAGDGAGAGGQRRFLHDVCLRQYLPHPAHACLHRAGDVDQHRQPVRALPGDCVCGMA